MDAAFIFRTGATPGAVAERAALEAPWAELLARAAGPRDFVERLVETGHAEGAAQFLAHALPRREAIWWALLCARSATDDSPDTTAALEAVRAWVAEPSDAARRNAFAHAEHVGLGTPWGMAGAAVFLSGDSLAPAGSPAVPPDPHDGARAVAGAVMLASVAGPEDPAAALRAFVDQGLALAERTQLWPAQSAGGGT